MGAVCIIGVMLMRVIQHYCNKRASRVFPTTVGGKVNYIAAFFTCASACALVLFLFTMGTERFDWLTVALAGTSGIALVIAHVCSLLALQSGTIVLNTIVGTASLIVPCVCGIFLFGEPMSVWQWVGILIFIGASALLASSAKSMNSAFSGKTVLLLLGSFLANGLTMVCQRGLTYWNPEGSVTLFSVFSFAVPAVLFALAVPAFRKPREGVEPERLNSKIWLPMVLLAFALFVINQLATLATQYIPSAILFPVLSGGNTLIATVVSAVCFGEKPTPRSLTALAICFGALMMINML